MHIFSLTYTTKNTTADKKSELNVAVSVEALSIFTAGSQYLSSLTAVAEEWHRAVVFANLSR